jgi:hypothetical protein
LGGRDLLSSSREADTRVRNRLYEAARGSLDACSGDHKVLPAACKGIKHGVIAVVIASRADKEIGRNDFEAEFQLACQGCCV